MAEKIIILDHGSQYTQLIARKIRENNVYCEIIPWNKKFELDESIKGIVLSGSPFSVHDANAPTPAVEQWIGKVPVLAVCYGAQYIAKNYGGKVVSGTVREYGPACLSEIFNGISVLSGFTANSRVWMSHGDTIMEMPQGYELICSTDSVKVAGYQNTQLGVYAVQFHPEVYHSEQGFMLISNFLDICKCKRDWTPESFIHETIDNIKSQVGNDKVILGLSGGVDSTVAAVLINQAIGNQLTGIFINNGLLRKDEFEQVLDSYKGMGLTVRGVDASGQFMKALEGIEDPEQKRKAIGRTFIEVFDQEAQKMEGARWLAQGTIYPDVIESVSVNGPSQTIKSHHNVGGLPEKMNLKILEPLRLLFKDEVRRVGLSLGISQALIGRHPFPGPGLAIRILGEVSPERVNLLQDADAIYIQKLRDTGLYDQVWQAFAVLLPIRSVGVMGDERTYENVLALRAVTSVDGMTADWAPLPYDFLATVSSEIINRVRGINRVVYDISSKPPATIEWE